MRNTNVLGLENSLPVLLYDLELPLEDRVKNVVELPSMASAARFLGHNSKSFFKNKNKRVTSKITGKVYAIRPKPQKSL